MTKSVKFANLTLIIGIIVCMAISLYVLSISDSHPPGSMHKYFLILIPVLAVLAAVLYGCKDKTKVNAALLFLSLGVSIYIIEISLSLYIINKDKKGIPVNSRSKFQLMMDLRNKGINAYPHVFPNDLIPTGGLDYEGTKIFPLGAISNKTTVFCTEEREPVIYETDEHGFRNPKGQYYIGGTDIALIGDSFAQGFCVKNGEDIAGQLRKNNRKILNLGMEGSGPLIELAILSEYAKHFQPKNVFWLYWEGNDSPNLSWEKASSTLMKYLNKNFSQDLVRRQDLVDNALIADIENKIANKKNNNEAKADPETGEESIIIKDKIKQVMKLNNLRLKLGLHRQCYFSIDPIFKDILIQAKTRVEEWGGQLHFVYLPAQNKYTGYKKNLCSDRLFHQQNQMIVSLVKELNINIIDMTIHFDSHSDPLSLFHGHYNSKGYELVAQKIQEYMLSIEAKHQEEYLKPY